ncbi:MAG: hypothetical protein KDA25_04365, partial [Phycisphaerales bacterium]|nr:hypothetical protein [Phycisphaerales bacterium]
MQSKDVVAKCEAEGIPNITNHMSTVSIGLAESIRQWFSEGADTTSVETAAPVNLDALQVRAQKRARTRTSAGTTA